MDDASEGKVGKMGENRQKIRDYARKSIAPTLYRN